MHVDQKAVIQNIEMARKIAEKQFGDTSPDIVLKVAGLIASREIKGELKEIANSLSYPLEIETK